MNCHVVPDTSAYVIRRQDGKGTVLVQGTGIANKTLQAELPLAGQAEDDAFIRFRITEPENHGTVASGRIQCHEVRPNETFLESEFVQKR